MDEKDFLKVQITALCINTVVATGIFFLQNHLPPMVPLFYGLPRGEAQLSPKSGLTIPTLIALVIATTNLLLIKRIKDDFVRKLLTALVIISTILALITTIRILLLVGQF
jgi:EamA domain-containing membrane protein RarD